MESTGEAARARRAPRRFTPRLRSLLLVAGVMLYHGTAGGWEDDFEGPRLGPRWQWRVPVAGPTLSLTDRPGWLRVRLPARAAGFNHWNEPQAEDAAPQLRTAVPEGDWQVEARVQLQEVAADGHFLVGLVAVVSDESLVGLGPFQGPTLPTGPTTPEVCLEPTGLSSLCRTPGEARDLRLRLERKEGLCRAQFSRDGNTWIDAGAYLMAAPPRFVGVIAKTFANGRPVVLDVDYVRLTSPPPWRATGRQALVGVGGEYPTGYRGLLARLGLPHEILVDYQMADAEVLRRFDLLLISGRTDTVSPAVRDALMDYVRAGGTALLDSGVFPPPAVVAGRGGPVDTKNIPDIVVGGFGNPLVALLGDKARFGAGESRFHFEPTALEGLQVLARFDGQPGRPGAAAGYTGTPALWAKAIGRGVLVYASPAIGATLSWGPTHDALAEALIQYLGWGRLTPQLVAEGARFGRKQSGLTETLAPAAATVATSAAHGRVQLTAAAAALPADTTVLRSKAAPEFNLSGTYRPERGEARLLLNYWSDRFQVTVAFKGASVCLSRTEDGKLVDRSETVVAGAGDVPFVLKERGDRIVLLTSSPPAALTAAGLWAGQLASSGQALSDLRYQPVEPPRLADDFMRGEKEQGAWEAAGGQWTVRATGDPKMGANPFTYRGQAQGLGMAVAGLPFWDEYAFAVSAKATSPGGAVAQAFYRRDPGNYFLFRIRVSSDSGAAKDGAEIIRVAAGKESVLARGDAALVKGQWYRLAVQVRAGAVVALVDGRPVATTAAGEAQGGKVALCVQDGEVEFDDVVVQPVSEATVPTAVELDGLVPRFAGTMDRDTWAGTALQWRADPRLPGRFWRRGRFFGDLRLSFRCDAPASPTSSASLALLLAPAEGPADGGYLATLKAAEPATPGRYEVELTAAGQSVGRCSVNATGAPCLELRRAGSRLQVLVDGRDLLGCEVATPTAVWSRLGFQATGYRPRLSGLRLEAGSVLDTCFDRAPVDWWVGSGTWDLAVRWPCTPEWSWLAGESRQVAALWHKRTFVGDLLVDLHVGPRTVDHGDGQHPHEICRAFNLVLCGDGQSVRSGYSIVIGADKQGVGATLSRQGQVVASNPAYRILSDAHNQWLNLRAERLGATIHVWVGDQRVLSWQDPEPLPGGRLAVWTEDNAIMIPRVTLYHRDS